MNFDLSNVGTANTTNLVATLQATGGVTAPSAAQNYGALVANGPAVTRPFTFTAGTTCGQSITATFQLQDGASSLGTVTFTFPTGALGAPLLASYTTGNVSTPIPDQGTVDIPIIVADTGVVNSIKVKVRLNHTYDGDVQMTLISPTGISIPLVTNRGSSGDNYGSGSADCSGTYTVFDDAAATAIGAGTAPFAGSFKPESPLAAVNGASVAGMWILHVADTAAVDTGTVFCVTLDITRQRYVCCGVTGAPQIASGGPGVLTAENFVPPNNAPDPGELVTVSLPVINTGDANTTSLVATLQTSGGVTPVTTTQNYGVVVAAGPAVSKSFSFVASGTCGGTITATLHMQDGALDLGNVTYTFPIGTLSNSTQTFSNTAVITIPATGTGATTGAPATPYPSNITVSGAPTTISGVTVKLNGFNHTFPGDVDILLVSPTGRNMIIMSDSGSSGVAVNLNITLDDAAAAALPSGVGLATGSFRPANYGTVQDPFPAPAPVGPYLTPTPGGSDTLTSAFAGAPGGNPNGTWSLYVVDDASGDIGNFNGGWELALIVTNNVCISNQAPVIQSGQPPDGATGTPYSFQFVASGAPTGITWSITGGTPPPNLVLDSSTGLFHGTPNSAGTFTFQVTAQNGVAPNAVVPYTVTIAPTTPYQSWRVAHFNGSQLADLSISGGSATPAGDGISNLQKYLFGLLPFTHSDNPAVLSNVGGHLVLTFPRSNAATDLTIFVEFSTDLGAGPFGTLTTWTSGGGWVPSVVGTTVSEVPAGSNTQVIVTDPTLVNSGGQRFLRLRPMVNP